MEDLIRTKICRDCFRVLALSSFHKHSEGKFGVRPECKECVRSYRRAYYKNNQEEASRYSRNFYAENAASVKAYQRNYAFLNPQKIRERAEKYRAENRESLLRKKRDYYYRNKEKRLEYFKKYCKDHPEYVRRSSHNRRARKRNAKGFYTIEQWFEKCEYFNWRCYLCGKQLAPENIHLEHRIPLSRGGTNWIANIAPACESCNLKKNDKTETEFRAMQPFSSTIRTGRPKRGW